MVVHAGQVARLNRTEPNALVGGHGSNPLDRVTGSPQGGNCRPELGLLDEQVVGVERRDDEDADARSRHRPRERGQHADEGERHRPGHPQAAPADLGLRPGGNHFLTTHHRQLFDRAGDAEHVPRRRPRRNRRVGRQLADGEPPADVEQRQRRGGRTLARHRNERLAGPHDDRLREVHPAAFANGRRRQQAQPLAGAGVDLEDRHPPPGLDALQVEPGDDPVVGEAEGEVRVFVERQHPTPLSAQTRTSPSSSTSTWMTFGRQQTGQSSTYSCSNLPTGRWARRSPRRRSRRCSWPRPSFSSSSSKPITLLVDGASSAGCLRYQLDLAGVIDFDVGPVVPAGSPPHEPGWSCPYSVR